MISDRIFLISFLVSLGLHLCVMIAQFVSVGWFQTTRSHAPLEVVYEQEVKKAKEDLHALREQLVRVRREAIATSSPATTTLGMGERAQIRIPERPALAAAQALSTIMPERSGIIDLTNLVDASRGDPVLLSYFGAIREQIQQTANHRTWSVGGNAEGLVYVSFQLTSGGGVRDIAIVVDRSTASSALQDIAVHIVKAAAPFPPFPPSVGESSKTIVVPLEFLIGS